MEKVQKTVDTTAHIADNHIPQYRGYCNSRLKITEIPQEKLSNTAILQTPVSPSVSEYDNTLLESQTIHCVY